jgi:hypothetical protein
MPTLTEELVARLSDDYPIDFERVTRVLLRDGWHVVYKTSEKDRAGLATTLKNLRRKLDNPDPRNPKTDAEMIAQYPQFIPAKENPNLQPRPFRTVTINGELWAVWNEDRSPVPVLAELMVPWHQILALDVVQERIASEPRKAGLSTEPGGLR